MRIERYMTDKMLVRNSQYILSYSKGYIFLRSVENFSLIKKHRINKWYKSIPIIERLLRYGPRMAVDVKPEIFLISNHGAFYSYDAKKNIIKKVYQFNGGMKNPLNWCIRRNENGGVEDVIFGDYSWNISKKAVSIYKFNMTSCEQVYTFPNDTITHIHNIIFDEIKKRYLILTGDDDAESAIWESDVDFTCVKKIVGGQQKYRACVAYPTERGIYYATDTPLEQNWLYYLDEHKNLHEIYKMPGPVIYGMVKEKCLFMATSVEGNPKSGKWKYRLSNKLGPGVKDRFVHIIKCDLFGNVEELACFKKDKFPIWLFQFGNAQFPITSDANIYVSTQSTKERGTFILKEEKGKL